MSVLASVPRTIVGIFRRIVECLTGSSSSSPSASLSAPTLPTYVERGGEQVFPPPFVFEDSVIHAFLVRADRDRLRALCDKQLNSPRSSSGLEYRPVGNRVVVARAGRGPGVSEATD